MLRTLSSLARILSSHHEQSRVASRSHAAEIRLPQPFRDGVAAAVRGVVDLQRLLGGHGPLPLHRVIRDPALELPDASLPLLLEAGLAGHAGDDVENGRQQHGEEEERQQADHHVTEEQPPADGPEELAKDEADRERDPVKRQRDDDEPGQEREEDQESQVEVDFRQQTFGPAERENQRDAGEPHDEGGGNPSSSIYRRFHGFDNDGTPEGAACVYESARQRFPHPWNVRRT